MHESRGAGGSSAMLRKELGRELEKGDEGWRDVVRLELVDDPSNDCRVRFCRKVLLDLTNLDPGVDIALERSQPSQSATTRGTDSRPTEVRSLSLGRPCVQGTRCSLRHPPTTCLDLPFCTDAALPCSRSQFREVPLRDRPDRKRLRR